jgi:hypothetical protein
LSWGHGDVVSGASGSAHERRTLPRGREERVGRGGAEELEPQNVFVERHPDLVLALDVGSARVADREDVAVEVIAAVEALGSAVEDQQAFPGEPERCRERRRRSGARIVRVGRAQQLDVVPAPLSRVVLVVLPTVDSGPSLVLAA